ncbi:MAG: ABC transporter substrate-binding protein [Clostridiaceae bacterium]
MKKLLLLFLPLIILLTSCSKEDPKEIENNPIEPVNLIYYTIGEPDQDLDLVNKELNRLLKEKINVTVQYKKVNWDEYGSKVNSLINTNGDFDILFAASDSQGDFYSNALQGKWLNLKPYLSTVGKEMYAAIDPILWQGVTVEDGIYGIPTNKELAVPENFVFTEELVKKYNIEVDKYHSFSSLEPLLEMIKEKEPEVIPLSMDSSRKNIFAFNGYEYIVSPYVPLMINSYDDELRVVNIYDTDYGMDILNTLHSYYVKGYINADAPIRTMDSLFRDERPLITIASGGPFSHISWSIDRGYPVVSNQISPAIITTESVRSSVMVVNSKTEHPEACVEFLNLINTDKEIRNLLNYGIEGVHYELTEEDQVKITYSAYRGVPYTQGNWFILHTTEGEPKDKWERLKAFNDTAVASQLFGFTPDLSKYNNIVNKIKAISAEYYPALNTGSVDPSVYVPKFLGELEEAGISELTRELQKQINQWKADNN